MIIFQSLSRFNKSLLQHRPRSAPLKFLDTIPLNSPCAIVFNHPSSLSRSDFRSTLQFHRRGSIVHASDSRPRAGSVKLHHPWFRHRCNPLRKARTRCVRRIASFLIKGKLITRLSLSAIAVTILRFTMKFQTRCGRVCSAKG